MRAVGGLVFVATTGQRTSDAAHAERRKRPVVGASAPMYGRIMCHWRPQFVEAFAKFAAATAAVIASETEDAPIFTLINGMSF